MRRFIQIQGILILSAVISCPLSAASKQTGPGDIIVGATGGYTMVEGYYKSRLKGTYNLGASFM
jgi:hypothetical protein